MKKRILALALLTGMTLSMPSIGKNVALGDLKEFSLSNVKPSDSNKIFDSNHWAYKTLKNITEKYGVLTGKPSDTFVENKPISRNEAAIILVNLMGKIQEQNLKIEEGDLARIEILQQELNSDIDRLSGRVALIEKDITELKGSVSRLEASGQKAWTNAFGEDFKITGGLQAAYTGAFQRGEDGYSPNFGLPYSEVSFSGKMMKNLDYKAQLVPTRNFTDWNANGLLRDIYISTDILPKHKIFVGQMARPVGEEAVLSPMEINFIDYSQASRKLLSNSAAMGVPYNHDVGVKIDGDWGLIDYSAGAFNGVGQNAFDIDRNMTIAGKASINPLYKKPEWGSLKLGGSILNGYHSSVALVGNGYQENIFGAHASYTYKKLCVSGELLGKDGFSSRGQDARAFFVDTIYSLNDKIQLLGRYDSFNPDTIISGDGTDEYVAGLNYLFRDNMMFMVNFVYVNNKFGKDSNRIGILSQVMF